MIDRILIENFKSIRQQELALSPINILIGANGAGKSNFINFFKLLNHLYRKNLEEYIAQCGGADNVLYFGLKNSEYLSGEIYFKNKMDEKATNRYCFKLLPNDKSGLFFSDERVGYNNAYSFGTENWLDNRYPSGESENRMLGFDGYRYDHTRRHFSGLKVYHFHDTSQTAKIKQKGKTDDNKQLHEDGGNLAAYLYYLQEKHPQSFKQIEAVIRSIAPFFDRFDLSPDRLNEQFIQLEWKEKSANDMYLNASNLSDGTLRMIALTTLLLQPSLPKTIIIDEPELGLHPFAINKLSSLLKKASIKSQIIVSTQSTNLVSNFTPEDIVTVDRQGKQTIFNRQDTEGLEIWLSDYSLGEIWEKNLIGGRP